MEKKQIFESTSEAHRELLLCFSPVIQAELNDFVTVWNSRFIRQSAQAPGGVPNMLFNFPESTGFEKQGIAVNETDIKIGENLLAIDHCPVFKYGDSHELFICYVRTTKGC